MTTGKAFTGHNSLEEEEIASVIRKSGLQFIRQGTLFKTDSSLV